ncbi:SRPBCC family protein [Frigoribacterium sp. Leaf172]|uniref:SRPBCC family protein n=1 Tax=Frigoribacterium sp. Leaf172 TaxID=1736285 RepID=UPI0006F514C2|nr:SRPBCC family protein [Frigoribacterium sp. Leaf172]KQR61826.1 hypothetical protein ASF89_15070 [Frigoribacterium sp. Leaf172]
MRPVAHSASRSMPHPPEVVRRVLVEASTVADWNPALSSVTAPPGPAVVGRAYPIRIRDLVGGRITYLEVGPTLVVHRLVAPGVDEQGEWRLEEARGGTVVTHRLEHRGIVLRVMHRAFEPVPAWRLERLAGVLSTMGRTSG